MSKNPGTNPFGVFLGLDGRPLNGGDVYIGLANQDPETDPQQVYWDADGLDPASQPLETLSGYIVDNGSVARFWTENNAYSIRVRDRLGNEVFYAANVVLTLPDGLVTADSISNDTAEREDITEKLLYIRDDANAVARSARDKMSDVVSVHDYDGTATEQLEFAIADMSDAGGGTVIINRDVTTLSPVTPIVVPSGVTIDAQWNEVRPGADIDLFHVRPGGKLKNLRANGETTAIGFTYTQTIATLIGDGGASNGFQGTNLQPWLDGFVSKLDLNSTNGRHIFLDAREQYLQEFLASNISLRGGNYGIHLLGDASDPGSLEYAQGNVFDHISMHGPNKFIYCQGAATAGNVFSNVMLQQYRDNPVCTVTIESSSNYIEGLAWDQVPVVVSGDGNKINLWQTHQYGTALTDTGTDNRAASRGSAYYNRTSINTSDDARHELNGPGRIEFRDMMLGGKDPRWVQAVTGSPTVTYTAGTFGATTGFNAWLPYAAINCPVGTNVLWNFNGRPCVRVEQNPNVHFTNWTNAGDQRIVWEMGLYADSNNYILLRQDFNTYADGSIRLVTRSGGTSTTTDLGTSASDRVNFCSLLISPTTVVARVKQYLNSGTGSTGRVADGVLWTGATYFTGTSTTNIPTSGLEPRVYVSQGSGGAAADLYVMDYQLVAGRKAQV